MSTNTQNTLPNQIKQAGELFLQIPLITKLAPAQKIQTIDTNGNIKNWTIKNKKLTPAKSQDTKEPITTAILLPPQDALQQQIKLPKLTQEETQNTINLRVSNSTPFTAGQTLHTWQQNQNGETQIAITSKEKCDQARRNAIQNAPQKAQNLQNAEIWLINDQESTQIEPLIFTNYQERQKAGQKKHWQKIITLALYLIPIIALAITPALLKRNKALQANAALDELIQRAAPAIAQRETIEKHQQTLEQLRQETQNQTNPAPALAMLTNAMPDDAWINQMRIEERKITINGRANDAADLVLKLSKAEGVENARLTSPATRAPNQAQEQFTIEINLGEKYKALKTKNQTTE